MPGYRVRQGSISRHAWTDGSDRLADIPYPGLTGIGDVSGYVAIRYARLADFVGSTAILAYRVSGLARK